MAASKTIGGINVAISATTDKFIKGVKLARRTLLSFGKAVKNFIFSMKGLAVVLAGSAFVKFTADQFDSIAALGDLSDKLGISTEKLAGFQLAAAEAGIANTVLERSLTTLGAKGLTLEKWIENTAKLTTHQEKLAASVEMFGVRGASMVRFLNVGSEGLKEAQRAAESLGLALDRKTVAGVDRAGEAFARFKMAVSGIFRSLAAEIAPFVEVLSNKAFDLLAKSGAGKSIGKGISDAIIWMAKQVADGIQKMVSAVLNFAADGQELFFKLRNSRFGQSLGINQSNSDAAATANSIFDARTRAMKFDSQKPWSMGIDSAIADARKKAAEQAALLPGSGRSLFSRGRDALGGLFTGPTAGNAKDFGGQLIQGVVQGIRSVPGLNNQAQWAGMMFQGNNFKGMTGAGFRSLSAQDPLSREGNAQRVRSLAQNDMQKIGRKQLDEQKKTRVAVEKIAANQPNRGPANLAGG